MNKGILKLFSKENVVKVNVLSKIFDDFSSEIKEFLEQMKETSIEEVLNGYSPLCDETIIKTLHENPDWKFIAGRFTLALNESKKHVNIDIKFYFQDSTEKWIQKANSNHMSIYQFKAESQQLILEKNILEFEINAPHAGN